MCSRITPNLGGILLGKTVGGPPVNIIISLFIDYSINYMYAEKINSNQLKRREFMNIRKTGIEIEARRSKLTSEGFNSQHGRNRRYESYVDMQRKLNKEVTAVVPFAEHFIKAMEKEGYKISEDYVNEKRSNN